MGREWGEWGGGREEAECKEKDTLPARSRREPMAESGSAFSRSSDFASLRSPCCPTPPIPAWRIKAPTSLTRALCLLPKDPGPKGGAAKGSGDPSIRTLDQLHRKRGGAASSFLNSFQGNPWNFQVLPLPPQGNFSPETISFREFGWQPPGLGIKKRKRSRRKDSL